MTSRFLVLVGAAAVATSFTSAPVAAEDVRVLRINTGICESARPDLIKWASVTEGYASYAVPVAVNKLDGNCTAQGTTVPAAYAEGFTNKLEADEAAKARCLATLPEGYVGCAVVANGFNRKE